MMNRSGCSILLRRPLATTLVGIAALVALAATVVAAGFATDAGRRGDMGLPPAEAVAAASLETASTPGGAMLPSVLSDLDRPDEASSGTDALADFGEGAAVRLLSDLGILALAGGPARDVQVTGTPRGMVVRAMPQASAADARGGPAGVIEPADGSLLTRPTEQRDVLYAVAPADEDLPAGQHDGVAGSATVRHDEHSPTWLAHVIAWLRGWLEQLRAS